MTDEDADHQREHLDEAGDAHHVASAAGRCGLKFTNAVTGIDDRQHERERAADEAVERARAAQLEELGTESAGS